MFMIVLTFPNFSPAFLAPMAFAVISLIVSSASLKSLRPYPVVDTI